MADRSPAAKHPEERRRREKPARGEWTDLEPVECEADKVLPELADIRPEPHDPILEGLWPQPARGTWAVWRGDPVPSQWSDSDVDYALETLELMARQQVSHASEIRLRLDALGLTPKGKRDLRLRLPAYVKAIEKTERRTAQKKVRDQRRAKLVSVK